MCFFKNNTLLRERNVLFFMEFIREKETYDGEPSGRRIRRVTTTFWSLWTVCRSFMERVLQTLMIVDLYGTAPRISQDKVQVP